MANALPAVESVALPEDVLLDVELPHLMSRLQVLTQTGVDVGALVEHTNTVDAALPAELAASALWWRLRAALHDSPPALPSQPDEKTMLDLEPVDPGPDPRWAATGHTPRGRIIELHHLAADYYRDLLPVSWARPYLADRLLLPTDELPAAGYAPPGPTSLLRHLEDLGANVEELVDAGLVKQAHGRDGPERLVDCFRDRIVFPIHDPRSRKDIVGFVGRRNPARDDAETAGPKYLNTRSTVAYAKSDNLFGLDGLHRHPSARLALVEGPLDALAITRATSGSVVGVAVLGTALTLDQARLIAHAVDTDRLILTAFDGDEAGTRASQACLTTLRQVGVHGLPAHLPRGLDPAAALQQLGPQALGAMLSSADDQVLVKSALSRDAASRSAGRRGADRVRSRER